MPPHYEQNSISHFEIVINCAPGQSCTTHMGHAGPYKHNTRPRRTPPVFPRFRARAMSEASRRGVMRSSVDWTTSTSQASSVAAEPSTDTTSSSIGVSSRVMTSTSRRADFGGVPEGSTGAGGAGGNAEQQVGSSSRRPETS